MGSSLEFSGTNAAFRMVHTLYWRTRFLEPKTKPNRVLPVVASIDSENKTCFAVDVGWWGVAKPVEAVQKYSSFDATRDQTVHHVWKAL